MEKATLCCAFLLVCLISEISCLPLIHSVHPHYAGCNHLFYPGLKCLDGSYYNYHYCGCQKPVANHVKVEAGKGLCLSRTDPLNERAYLLLDNGIPTRMWCAPGTVYTAGVCGCAHPPKAPEPAAPAPVVKPEEPPTCLSATDVESENSFIVNVHGVNTKLFCAPGTSYSQVDCGCTIHTAPPVPAPDATPFVETKEVEEEKKDATAAVAATAKSEAVATAKAEALSAETAKASAEAAAAVETVEAVAAAEAAAGAVAKAAAETAAQVEAKAAAGAAAKVEAKAAAGAAAKAEAKAAAEAAARVEAKAATEASAQAEAKAAAGAAAKVEAKAAAGAAAQAEAKAAAEAAARVEAKAAAETATQVETKAATEAAAAVKAEAATETAASAIAPVVLKEVVDPKLAAAVAATGPMCHNLADPSDHRAYFVFEHGKKKKMLCAAGTLYSPVTCACGVNLLSATGHHVHVAHQPAYHYPHPLIAHPGYHANVHGLHAYHEIRAIPDC